MHLPVIDPKGRSARPAPQAPAVTDSYQTQTCPALVDTIRTLTMILHKTLVANVVHVTLAISVMVVVVVVMMMCTLQILWRGTRSIIQMILIAFETIRERGLPI